MSSTEVVKSEISSGLSAKVIMKNSSCGLAVLKNSITASRARSILLLMLPLMSNITPRETGASSLEKVEIFAVKARQQPVHRISDRHRHEHHLHIHTEGLGVAFEGGIIFRRFRGWLRTRLDVYILGRILGKTVKSAEGRYNQDRCPY